MAEIIDHVDATQHIPSNSKTNTALTLGIIGTAVGALSLMGRGAGRNGLLSPLFGCGGDCGSQAASMTAEDLYIEREQCKNYIATTKQYYEGQLAMQDALHKDFAEAYKRDVDNSFGLYKYSRDSNDILMSKINEVDKKVDVMAAIRPYQDALINAKIDNTALLGDFNLQKRTCRMIQGQLVLPSTPVVSGYGSYGCLPQIVTNPTGPTA